MGLSRVMTLDWLEAEIDLVLSLRIEADKLGQSVKVSLFNLRLAELAARLVSIHQ